VDLGLRDGQSVQLHFNETELLRLLEGAGLDARAVWGEPLPDEEAAARFLIVHLEESLATQEAHPSGWWEYEHGFFTPGPPWEAFTRSRHEGDAGHQDGSPG
jgi:hypothetical protein